MLRLIGFLILLAPFTYGALWLADRPGAVEIQWQGYQLQMALGILVALALLAAFILLVAFMLVRSLLTSPRKLRQKAQLKRYENGLEALNKSMVSIALADHSEAQRQVRRAKHFLQNNPPITQLLEVQIAHATGKESAARIAFDDMLENDLTRPVALRGKIGELLKKGELVHARDFAEEAYAKRPQDSWLAMVLFDILFREKDWPAIDALIDRAKRKAAISKDQAAHFRAMGYLLRAQDALGQDQAERALDMAQLALRQQPKMLAARLLLAQIVARKNNVKALLNTIEESWKITPHPLLAELFLAHACDDTPAKIVKRLERLVTKNPDHLESFLLQAQIFIHLKDWTKARNTLKLALSKGESARVYQMFAEIETGEKGDDKAASNWLEQALTAAKDMQWICGNCQHVHSQWQSHCAQCNQFDALDWALPNTHPTGPNGAVLL